MEIGKEEADGCDVTTIVTVAFGKTVRFPTILIGFKTTMGFASIIGSEELMTQTSEMHVAPSGPGAKSSPTALGEAAATVKALVCRKGGELGAADIVGTVSEDIAAREGGIVELRSPRSDPRDPTALHWRILKSKRKQNRCGDSARSPSRASVATAGKIICAEIPRGPRIATEFHVDDPAIQVHEFMPMSNFHKSPEKLDTRAEFFPRPSPP
jgi:hypothetical protein